MGQLDKKSLLKKEELPIEKVDLGGGDFVYVKSMTGHERDQFEQLTLKQKLDEKGTFKGFEQVNDDFRAKLVVMTVCDEKGNLLLEPKDFLELSINMGITKLEKIMMASLNLNKITEKDVEDLTKNSKPDLGANSSSVSVGNLK
jgi:hypothetical protein